MEIEALQETVYHYSQRLKTLEDFISFQFGESYQQFRCQKIQDEETEEVDGSPWEKPSPSVSQKGESSGSSSSKVSVMKIKREIIHLTPDVPEDETGTGYNDLSEQQSSSSILYSNKKADIRQQLCYLVPESLEVDFVSDPPSEIDPLEVQEEGFWIEDNDNEDDEINDSELYEMYEEDEEEEQTTEIMPKITGTTSCGLSITASSSVNGQITNQNEGFLDLKYKAHECPFCVSRFDSRNTMFQHIMDDHTGGENYCPMCQKSYTFQKDFRCHLSRHDKRNRIRFKCSYCVKYFGSRKELNNHERIHTGEKPYSCATCQRVFRTSSSLIRHQKCHGTYVCKLPDCKLRFLLYKELMQHQKETKHYYAK